MKNLLFLSLLFCVFLTTSCEVEVIDPDYASAIEGTYKMTSLETSPTELDLDDAFKVVIDRDSDKQVDIKLDFGILPIDLDNITVAHSSDDNYTFSKVFNNATVEGTVRGTKFDLTLDYDDGDSIIVEAEKE